MNRAYKIRNHLLRIVTSLFLALLITITTSQNSLAENSTKSFIEISKSHRSESLGDIHSLSLYSSLISDRYSNSYAGIQLITFEKNIIGEEDTVIKVFVGQDMGGTFSPFYEIGTDLYGFFSLLDDNNNDSRACTEDQKCAIDMFFRLGMRVKLGKNLTLNIFHENIDFGDFHIELSGEHNYTGSSLGFRF